MEAKLLDRSGVAVTVLFMPDAKAGEVPEIVAFGGRMFVLGDADGRPSKSRTEAHYYEALVYNAIPHERPVGAEREGAGPACSASLNPSTVNGVDAGSISSAELASAGKISLALGALAYGAYRGVSLANGRKLPDFETLGSPMLEAWIATGEAVFCVTKRVLQEAARG